MPRLLRAFARAFLLATLVPVAYAVVLARRTRTVVPRRLAAFLEVVAPWALVGGRALRRRFGPRVRRHPLRSALVGLLVLALTLAGGIPLLGLSDDAIAWTGETIFDVEPLPEIARPAERSRLLDANGGSLGVLSGPENRVVVPLTEMPQVLIDAVIATEDADFYEHEGVDAFAIARAAFVNVVAGEVEQGGSTITQQYVKNALLSSERSLDRKVTEATWAVRLEQELTKDEILERYLNIAYFGEGAYGVAAASERFFGRPVQELDLARAAVLAGVIQRPGATNPLADRAAATARRDVVLARMVDENMITAEQADDARVPLADLLDPTTVPQPTHQFFVEHVRQELLAAPELGDTREERASRLYGGGLTIRTTLDTRMQQIAEQTISDHLTDPVADPLAGLVSVDPATGAVRTMAVGPKAFGVCEADVDQCTTTKVNPLVPGLGGSGRQVGSAFKPFVVAAALADGADTDWHTDVTSGQTIPGCGSYAPNNYDRSGGVDDLVEAITESNNVFHVKLAEYVGQAEVAGMANRLGISSDLGEQCALALGAADVFPLDMAVAYATFANGGIHCRPYVVAEVIGPDGTPLLEREPDCSRVIDEKIADTVTTLLRRVVERGTARRARLDGREVAAKTGTTNDYRDAWLVGYTPQLATAAWIGFEQPQPMRGILGYRSISGGTLPAVLWADFMSVALEPVDAVDLPSVDLDRYWAPACPPPPSTSPDGGDKERDANEDDKKKDEKDRQQASDPREDLRYDGFDASELTLDTGVDGDSFEDGIQPEQCVTDAPPEAYAPLLPDSEGGEPGQG